MARGLTEQQATDLLSACETAIKTQDVPVYFCGACKSAPSLNSAY